MSRNNTGKKQRGTAKGNGASAGGKAGELPELPVMKLASIADSNAMFRNLVSVHVFHDGKMLEYQCRQLMAEETAQLTAILQRCLPPFVTDRVEGEEKPREYYNTRDEGYRERKAIAERQARALAVYFAWEPMRKEYPDIQGKLEEVLATVERVLPEKVIIAIANQVADDGQPVSRVASFF